MDTGNNAARAKTFARQFSVSATWPTDDNYPNVVLDTESASCG